MQVSNSKFHSNYAQEWPIPFTNVIQNADDKGIFKWPERVVLIPIIKFTIYPIVLWSNSAKISFTRGRRFDKPAVP